MTLLPGLLALLLILGTLVAALAGISLAAGPARPDLPWAYIFSVVRFTLLQATLSTALSVVLGAGLALALARRQRFAGRSMFIAALNLASVLPAIVAVFGIVAVLGRSGLLGQAAGLFGLDPGSWLYGLPGILIAHVFFNAPLAARVFLASLAAVPGEHWRVASQLGMGPGALFRFVDLPLLRREAPGVAALIFLLCFTSFAVVLALGGGPRAATLEVAIYGAVRFDVDFARAGALALLQIAVCLLVVLPLLTLGRRPGESAGAGADIERPDVDLAAIRSLDIGVLAIGGLLVLPPLAAIGGSGLLALRTLLRADVAEAALTSFVIAVPAAFLAVGLALALATGARALRAAARPRWGNAMLLPAGLVLAVPPIAVSAGLFVVLRMVADPFVLAVPMIVLINGLMALPFALRQVDPPLILSAERYGMLAESLGINAWHRMRIVDWPLLKRPLLAALAVATALSLGDLGVAAFFGTGNVLTLPLLLHQRLGSYRLDEAASVAFLLALLVLGLFLVAQKASGEPLARSR